MPSFRKWFCNVGYTCSAVFIACSNLLQGDLFPVCAQGICNFQLKIYPLDYISDLIDSRCHLIIVVSYLFLV